MINDLIERIFADFTVDDVAIPVKFVYYNGHDDAYIVYHQQDANNSLTGDNELIGYVAYYDFDVYSKGNYEEIVESMMSILEENGFVWQPSRSSMDLFEPDTGYYYRTFNFAYLKEET